MSKTTASAAGGAMPAEGQKTRRTALALFAGAPALAILPAAASALALVSTASPLHPDAALLAMQSAIDAADRELDAALAASNLADDAYSNKEPDRPKQPEIIFLPEEQQALDAFAAKLRARRDGPSLPEWVAWDQAFADYEREVERLKAERGVTAAHEIEDAAYDAIRQARADLVDTPAKTLAGLIFKARYASAHYEGDYDKDVMVSIVDDLLAMADHPEDGANV
jgi:hypothetical protein